MSVGLPYWTSDIKRGSKRMCYSQVVFDSGCNAMP
jgi:hypothetical protein